MSYADVKTKGYTGRIIITDSAKPGEVYRIATILEKMGLGPAVHLIGTPRIILVRKEPTREITEAIFNHPAFARYEALVTKTVAFTS